MLTKYWVEGILVLVVLAVIGGWIASYGSKKWHQGYDKRDAEYAEAAKKHQEKVTVELPKVEKKYAKKLKSVQGSSIPVGPATAAALDSLRLQYSARHR